MSTRSPSKYQSIENLRAIKADHFLAKGGKEFSEEELDVLLWEKLEARASRDAVTSLKVLYSDSARKKPARSSLDDYFVLDSAQPKPETVYKEVAYSVRIRAAINLTNLEWVKVTRE
jgi:hypothetical protein